MTFESRLIPTAQNPDVISCIISIDGNEISKKHHLTSLNIQNEINKIPSAILQFLDGDPSKESFDLSDSDEFVPGKKISIQLGYHEDAEVVFEGVVITNTHKINNDCSELTVECKHEAVRMTINRSNRTFRNKVDTDIVSEILDDNDIDVSIPKQSTTKHEQLVQSNVSDWDYLVGRADVVGMICVIDNESFTVKKPNLSDETKLDLTFGADILEFYADMDARTQTSTVKTMCWDFENQEVRVVESEDSGAPDEGRFSRSDLADVNSQPLEMRTSATLTQEETQDIANAKKLRQDLSKIKAKVKYQGTTAANPGDFVSLNGVGKNFNGKAFVSAIQHEYSDGDWTTEATLGWTEQFFAEQTNPTHAASATGQPSSIHGLHIGIVTGITDDTGQYRIKVRLPIVNEQDEEGIFARVATLDAGDKRGTFFRPEIDDEVLVGFMNDDSKNPVVLGMLHSSAKSAPLEPDDQNPQKGYVSRSGIELIFDDDKKSIRIETPGNRVFELNDDEGSITLQDANGNKMVFDDNGISIESALDLKIKATSSISISAPQVSVKADGTLKLESSGSTTLSSDGMTEVKGSMVKIN